MPGLEELLGQAPQRLGIGRGIDGPVHPLKLEFLAEAEGERFGHGERRKGSFGLGKATNCFEIPRIRCDMEVEPVSKSALAATGAMGASVHRAAFAEADLRRR